MAYASADDEVDHLDQKITNALHQIDENFSMAREASTALLRNVQRFGKEIGRVHDGAQGMESIVLQLLRRRRTKVACRATKARHHQEKVVARRRATTRTPNRSGNGRATARAAAARRWTARGLTFSIDMSPPKDHFFSAGTRRHAPQATSRDEGEGPQHGHGRDADAKRWALWATNERRQRQKSQQQERFALGGHEAVAKLNQRRRWSGRNRVTLGIASPGGSLTPLAESPARRGCQSGARWRGSGVNKRETEACRHRPCGFAQNARPGLSPEQGKLQSRQADLPAENEGGRHRGVVQRPCRPASVARNVRPAATHQRKAARAPRA